MTISKRCDVPSCLFVVVAVACACVCVCVRARARVWCVYVLGSQLYVFALRME